MFLTAEDGMILGPIAFLLGKILNFIYNMLYSGGAVNLGLVIILFTIIVKLIMSPLTFKQQKSAKINAYIQPEIEVIKKKYKNKKDQETMIKINEETQAVYKKYGTSMASGCLPALIQMPIIFALYRVIQNIPAYVDKVKDLYIPIANNVVEEKGFSKTLIDFVDKNKITGANTAVKNMEKLIKDGTTPDANNVIDILANFSSSNWDAFQKLMSDNGDVVSAIVANVPHIQQINTFLFGINIAEAPGWKISPALVIPLAAGLFQFLSSKILQNPQQTQGNDMANSMMKSMIYTMPLFSIVMCVGMPAGVGIYWTLSSVVTLVIQLVINFYYKHADMEKIIAKSVAKADKKRAKKGNKKSLMDRVIEKSTGQSADTMSAAEKAQFVNSMSSKNLRNYDSSTINNNPNRGNISSKANILLNYDEQKNKGGDK